MSKAQNNHENKGNNNNQNEVESTKTKQAKNEGDSEVATKVAKREEKEEAVIKSKDSEKGESQAVRKDSSTEAEDYVLSVVQALDQSRINVERLRIEVDGNTVFSMKDGNINNAENRINERQAELLKQALKDPGAMKGSVTISQGRKVLLRIDNGRVITDSIGLVKESAKIEVESPEPVSEEAYKGYSEGVKEQGLAGSQKIALNALNDGVDRSQVTEMMKSYNADYQKLANKSGDNVAERMVVSQAEVNLMQSKMRQSEQQSQERKNSQSRGRSL